MEKMPNLIDKDNNRLQDIEMKKRGELLSNIKEKRLERDDLLKESTSFKTKVKDIFGCHEKEKIENQVSYIQADLYRQSGYKKDNIYKELNLELQKIIIETITGPILELRMLFLELRNLHPGEEKSNLLKDKINNIINNFKFQNIVEGLDSPELANRIFHCLSNFLSEQDSDLYEEEDNKEIINFSKKLSNLFLSAVSEKVENGKIFKYTHENKFLEALEKSRDIAGEQDDQTNINLSILMNDSVSKVDVFYLAQRPNLIDLAANTSNEFRKNLSDKIDTLFSKENWSDINRACKSSSKYLSEIALSNLNNYLKIYEISVEDIKFAWELLPTEDTGVRSNNIERNINKMKELELSRPGIVNSLFTEFGIKEFHRYPSNALIKQFDTKDQDIPYGLVLFTNNDHNDAFDSDTEIIESMFKQTNDKILMRIAEFKSRFSFLKNLAYFNNRYGKKNKIEYLLWGAHGWIVSIGDISVKHLNGDGAKRTKDFFVEKPEIILASCSTGAEGAIAQKMSEIYDATVHAPAIPSNLDNILVNFDQENKIHFQVDFKKNCGKTYSQGNKIEN